MPRIPSLVVLSLVVAAACGGEPPAGRSSGGAETGELPPDQRSASPSPPEPSDTVPAVVFLGTSLTAGYGLPSPDSAFPARIARMLDSAGYSHPVVDAGVPGETSAGGVRRVGRALDRPLAVVVVELGANDGLRGLDPAALEANLQAIVDSVNARRPRARILLAGMEAPPNLGPEYTARFREAFAEVERRNPDVHRVPFLLEGVAGVEEMNQADGIHPNPRGHRRIAETLWPHLEPLLDGGKRGSEG